MAICALKQRISKSKDEVTELKFKCCWIAVDLVPITKGKSFMQLDQNQSN